MSCSATSRSAPQRICRAALRVHAPCMQGGVPRRKCTCHAAHPVRFVPHLKSMSLSMHCSAKRSAMACSDLRQSGSTQPSAARFETCGTRVQKVQRVGRVQRVPGVWMGAGRLGGE
eukprot:365712-Chlamydomonas_euryale.AAC.1